MNTNNISLDKAITHAFEQIEVALNQKLKVQGYKILPQQATEPDTTDKSIIWLNNTDAFRLSWEAEEAHFVLQSATSLPLSPSTVWNNIITAPYNPAKYDEHYIVTLAAEFIDSLE